MRVVHLCPVGIFRRYQKHGDASSWNRLPRRSRPFLSLLSYRAIFCQRAGRSGFSDLVILCTQCFRIGVELFLHQLWMDGLVPQMQIFEGANVDIYRQRP